MPLDIGRTDHCSCYRRHAVYVSYELRAGAAARVTETVYVLVELSCAVTTMVIVLLPIFSAISPDADPLDTAVPFTVTVAFDSFTVGVTVIEVTAYATLAV
jgi:hypothetical protein